MIFEIDARLELEYPLPELLKKIFSYHNIQELSTELAKYGFKYTGNKKSLVQYKNNLKNPFMRFNDFPEECVTCELVSCPPTCENLENILSFLQNRS